MNAIGVTGEGKKQVHLAERQRRSRSLGTSDRRDLLASTWQAQPLARERR
jgi:hypothetical protein